jgi:SAM-dependent methyltransferase
MLTVDYDRLGLRPGQRLLDLGCGAGRHAYEALRRGARVVAYDLDAGEVKDTATVLEAMVSEGLAGDGGAGWAVNGDALHLPFPDGAFDCVIAAEILEHIPLDTAAIAELVRVLKPGGAIAVTVPRWGPELVNWALSDTYHLVPGGHIRIYRKKVLADRLRQAGLSVIGTSYAHALHSPYWWLRCAVGLEASDDHRAVRMYHQLLVWEIEGHRVVSPMMRAVDAVLNPLIGKSMVLYGRRSAARPTDRLAGRQS